jgi:predicted ATPase
MAELPSGTVTLLFTDIEGSTRLLEELGPDAYGAALEEHRRLLRAAFGRHGGYEVDTAGDAFFVAFSGAMAAMSAAAEAQAALADGRISVRMGLHTGEPVLQSSSYVGRDVHLAARVMSAGHGGQVLLTGATREFVQAIELRDLGEHRLKDFAEPVHLFQLGADAFPPLKTISNTNLPRPASSFVGRERELAEVVELVRSGARFATLTGPGGSGKTRLAVEAAAELLPDFKAGVFWISLAVLRDPRLVVETIAQTLGAKEKLAAHIAERELLLVIDNFEQVVAAGPDLAELIEACPNLVLLVTSRELLRVRGEIEYQVLPLAEAEAVDLFCARARLDRSQTIEDLCRRLDAMPLALELAAARTRALTPEQILERLEQRLDLLKGGRDADPRQQTLRATIEWSHDLLSSKEQALFAQLAVFAGGFTLAAAEAVVGADVDGVQSLGEKSLLRRTSDRFWMLETIREFASERLASSQAAPGVRQGHADWVLGWGSQVNVRQGDQAQVLRTLRDELPNIRVAFDELTEADRACDRMRLATGLAQAMFHLGLIEESKSWLLAALPNSDACPPSVRTEALVATAMQCGLSGEAELAREYAAQARELADRLDDPTLRLETIMAAAAAHLVSNELDPAAQLSAEALAQAEQLADHYRATELRNNLSYIALLRGDYESAQALAQEGIADARRDGNHAILATLYHNFFLATFKAGALHQAMHSLREALEVTRLHSLAATQAYVVEGVAAAAAQKRDYPVTATLLGATESTVANVVFSIERELRLEAEQQARSALGSKAFLELHTAGSRLSLEDASERAALWLATERATPDG